MNAQRSVWSSPPLIVQQKYEIYFGGTIDDPWYTENPRIRLWWTDAEMKRLAYRELHMPAGLRQLVRIGGRRPPPLASVTQDNIALFLDVLDRNEEIKARYVVCDPEQVLRYGLVTLPPEIPSWNSFAVDPGSWTWDGDTVWPLYRTHRSVATQVTGYFVYACRIDTRTNTADSLRQLFEGYYRIRPRPDYGAFHEWYYCESAGWVATDPQAPNGVLANILYFFSDPDYPSIPSRVDYTARSQYLPGGPSPIFMSGTSRSNALPTASLTMLGTFPVGPTGIVLFEAWSWEPEWYSGTLYIVVDDRAVLQIPVTRVDLNGYFYDYYHMTNTGLPYNLTVPLDEDHRLLRCSGDRALVFLRRTWRFTEGELVDVTRDPLMDALIEFDLRSGRATKDIVVPTIRPRWGMEYNGAMLATPMMTSSKGRLNLP